MRNKLRKTTVLLCLAAILLGLSACGSSETGEAADAVFRVGTAQSPDSLNPFVTEGGISEEFFLLCYNSLWRQGPDRDPVPDLVDSWSLSSDNLTWTIRLRQDAAFSDGSALTAEDVVFTYGLMCHSKSIYSGYFEGISSIRCPDDFTVVITTEYVKGDMMENPTPILPEHIWSSYEFSPESFDNAEMIGSGPFLLETAEDEWIFRARSQYLYDPDAEGRQIIRGETEYRGDSPATAVIDFVLYGTETGAARALAAGEVDASFGLADIQFTTLDSVPGVTLVQSILPGALCEAMVFNTREDRLFEDAAMRRIMEQCMDREWLLSMSSGGLGRTGSVFASPGTEYFLDGMAVNGFDPDAARNQLQLAGYSDIDDDGILENNKTEDELSLTLYTGSDDIWAATAAAIFSDTLESIGIEVRWSETESSLESVCTAKADWDICMYSWYGNLDAVIAAGDFYEKVSALSGWTSAPYESGLAILRTCMDAADVHTQVKALQQTAYDDCPCVVLCYAADVQAVRNDRWTGFESTLDAEGSLFRTGCRDIYMSVSPIDTE